MAKKYPGAKKKAQESAPKKAKVLVMSMKRSDKKQGSKTITRPDKETKYTPGYKSVKTSNKMKMSKTFEPLDHGKAKHNKTTGKKVAAAGKLAMKKSKKKM
jgi:hypothetical protein